MAFFLFGTTLLAFLVWMSRHLQIGRVRRLMPPIHSGMYQEACDKGGTRAHEQDTGSPANPQSAIRNADLPSVSILVAAKDEEANIESCLHSLLGQDYPNFEVIAINDRSTDRTGEIVDRLAAGADHVTTVHIQEIHPGWFGKNNAMRAGTAHATGEWLCFTDADCVFVSQRALLVAMRFALEKGADFLSVLPVHETNSFPERVIQPACSGIMMIWFNPTKVNDPRTRTAYANGAFMLMRRSCYEALGGHKAVKTELNEDMHMARRAKEAGQRLVVVSNKDLYTVRMYQSISQIWSGWSRIFYGCFGTLRQLSLSILVVTVFSLLPWAALLAAATTLWLDPGAGTIWQVLVWAAGAACVAQASVMSRFYALNHIHPLYGLLYPVGAAVGFGALVNALQRLGSRGTITWRGTAYRGSQVATRERP